MVNGQGVREGKTKSGNRSVCCSCSIKRWNAALAVLIVIYGFLYIVKRSVLNATPAGGYVLLLLPLLHPVLSPHHRIIGIEEEKLEFPGIFSPLFNSFSSLSLE